MAKTDFELYSKTRVYVYDLDTTLDKMVKHKKPRLGDKIGHLLTMNYKFRNNPEMGVNKFIRRMNSYYGFMIHLNGYKARVKLYKAIADSVFSTYVKNYHYKYIKLNTT